MTAGRVTVNGVVVRELGSTVDPASDVVAVDGAAVALGGKPVYIALHKPAGYVSTMRDPQGRQTVAELVPADRHPGLFPVGRLDRETTGLLLFTTDGELSHRLLHPRWHVSKDYRVRVDGCPSAAALRSLRDGIDLDDGPTQPADVTFVAAGPPAELSITIREGRKRQIRRMLSAVGHPVLELERVGFGPVDLGDLPVGKTRILSDDEVHELRAETGMES
jgi:23S rRNA pseudouridine2605 synthase